MIKIILVAFILIGLIYALRHRNHVGLLAGRRLLLVLVGVFGVVSVIDPRITTAVANEVGVTRGTDLLLYALVVTFAFTSANVYFRLIDLESRTVQVAREFALREAARSEQPPVEY
jgi:hypothetical protein